MGPNTPHPIEDDDAFTIVSAAKLREYYGPARRAPLVKDCDLPQTERRYLLPDTSTQDIIDELRRRKQMKAARSEHGRRMQQQKRKAKNRKH